MPLWTPGKSRAGNDVTHAPFRVLETRHRADITRRKGCQKVKSKSKKKEGRGQSLLAGLPPGGLS
ncbi:hypothetical protein EYF80_035724 [Liparis tanakae]|uniref:Uncharacterized protein n=1 Tax=Liparis tanakae TaxID=230148 RepID=A0A4Z2GMS8_9TELE|nr:hypothetical protein EYF80_035724 [Liparis tanakae]